MTEDHLYSLYTQSRVGFCLILLISVLVSCSDNHQYIPKADNMIVSPVCPVLSTCQNRCRAPGDDGYWLAGKYLSNEKRFEDHGDGVFTDHLTGQMWMFALPTPEKIGYGEMVKSSDGAGITGNLFIKEKSVSRFLDEMNAGHFKGYGKGFSDWRWPSVVELVSLFQFTKLNRGVDRQYFGEEFVRRVFGSFDDGSFTSSTDVTDADGGKFQCSLAGAVKKISISRYPDVCLVLVRSITSVAVESGSGRDFAELPETGPRKTNPEVGKQWPNPRFKILRSGSEQDPVDDIVIDHLTGLFWTRDSCPAGKKNWHDALKYCNDLRLGGYDDWRMPNVFEMLSIVCYGFDSPAMVNTSGDSQWKEGDPFRGVMNELYWTSTAEEPRSDHSYVVDMNYGTLKTDYGQPIRGLLDRVLGEYPKHFFWPVRGGDLQNHE